MEEERKRRKRRHRRLTGEDIDMFREREHEDRKKNYVPICDRHIDGAQYLNAYKHMFTCVTNTQKLIAIQVKFNDD